MNHHRVGRKRKGALSDHDDGVDIVPKPGFERDPPVSGAGETPEEILRPLEGTTQVKDTVKQRLCPVLPIVQESTKS